MSKAVCITNRTLCGEDFLERIEKIAAAHPRAIILREKDLSEDEYKALAKDVMAVCEKHGTECILHTFADAAIELGAKAIHLPLGLLLSLDEEKKAHFSKIGASTHSLIEAAQAKEHGASYITASHIFVTDCKKGLEPRGLEFLKNVCENMDIEVYALGGINTENAHLCFEMGADAVCAMSGFMQCENPAEYVKALDK